MAKKKLPEPKEITKEITGKCTCNIYKWKKHHCPYQADVNNDEDFKCHCCPFCTQNCADNI